jgi:hypothetical protein
MKRRLAVDLLALVLLVVLYLVVLSGGAVLRGVP